ncbi:Probable acylpyruvase FAHD2, mitochondrial [Seminavis robusta]|uniref:Probable acylpyruvase FAHD2, mitochondrial n=1 Tax=Seminavis robusta TaxID=568900 RepID=A0A9N8D6W8_9STRA|nr:Probable acylpyruvase FAHD2, mitochondrial [Seminavis robusta]|eukprot:Sro22_g015260.1 Probable acylpyruvase FAHD2, mitochondrial (244) ;mRNA; r:55999-56730
MKSNTVLTSTEHILKHGRKIVCIGRNYVEHAKELGNPVPKEPFFFLKPTTSYIRSGSIIILPNATANVHHEIELGVVIGNNEQACQGVSEEQAMSHIKGYLLALDLTERTLQGQAKNAGKPWSMSKGFDTFCPISDQMIEATATATALDPSTSLWCKVNGQTRQNGPIGDMIFSIPKLISYISDCMTLQENDVILTGTPQGVGPIVPGDVIEGGLVLGNLQNANENANNEVLSMKFEVAARDA